MTTQTPKSKANYNKIICSCGVEFGNTDEEAVKAMSHLGENIYHYQTPISNIQIPQFKAIVCANEVIKSLQSSNEVEIIHKSYDICAEEAEKQGYEKGRSEFMKKGYEQGFRHSKDCSDFLKSEEMAEIEQQARQEGAEQKAKEIFDDIDEKMNYFDDNQFCMGYKDFNKLKQKHLVRK